MPDSRFPPERFFDGKDLKIAEAIYDNDRRMLKNYIKEPGFDINKLGKQNITFLLYALYAGQMDMVEILLENGADSNLINPEIDSTNDPIWKNTISDELPLSFIARSYSFFDLADVKLLLKYGAKINDSRVNPALIACMVSADDKRKLKLIDYLLDKGADINIKGSENRTPILAAADISLWDIVNYLLDHGADYTAEDNAGWSVAYNVQDEIEMNKGTDERKQKVHALKRRLEGLGVAFPVQKGINIYDKKEVPDSIGAKGFE
ncbi:ankyrin repeat domain-containing protein [Sphingobacterium sp. MYb382]|uniref:ankyrin repeat domain-containing protein n=1 Tax=Sphingobacterium sp. MYb382 TaxID=2745278 RepID=UPI0030A86CBD